MGGGPVELFLILASAPQLWVGAHKIFLVSNQRVTHVVAAAGFLSHCLSGTLSYV